jgi:hypothetical protein
LESEGLKARNVSFERDKGGSGAFLGNWGSACHINHPLSQAWFSDTFDLVLHQNHVRATSGSNTSSILFIRASETRAIGKLTATTQGDIELLLAFITDGIATANGADDSTADLKVAGALEFQSDTEGIIALHRAVINQKAGSGTALLTALNANV